MNAQMDLTAILERLAKLEAETAIRNCINRYMEICDALNAHTDLNELMNLFADDAVWEGVGEKYAASFGRYEGRLAIGKMFQSYMQQDSHFILNAHFVSSEQIYVKQQQADTSWLMLQSSTFRDGRSHLNAAKLTVRFQQQTDGTWKIQHFQTENIFSRPISHWNSTAELPVPNQK
ncbi:nuclear transport factor 2 family protein [Acinetobacter defluvii]|uniref:Nuclear transport factor 2 family protein n=1 Tax=Acinetobacter defluvii TaxID=1871111 RepID=A0A2S2FE42_9GAMM|nr:nuclear transport factor 2 family protein [Acinetobacter defluvii]AWL29170.1 nuclear transport factor 2 family protein [Acinetobacter defluvii]